MELSLGRGNVLQNCCDKGDDIYRIYSLKLLGTEG